MSKVKVRIKYYIKLVIGPRFSSMLNYCWQRKLFNKSLKLNGLCIKKIYDVLVYCEQPSHWQNVQAVVKKMLESHPNIEMALITTYTTKSYPSAVYPNYLTTLHGVHGGMLKFFNARVLLTPNVGFSAKNKPINSKLVHSLVSLMSLDGVYADSNFNGYDYILCAGSHHLADFQGLANRQPNLRGKLLIPAGYPKLDLAIHWAESHKQPRNPFLTTVIYAPTHVTSVNEQLASLRTHGIEIVRTLLDEGYHVIFRPHPVSLRDADMDLVDKIVKENANNKRFELDQSKEYQQTYSRAEIMITDLSGTGFTYSLSFRRPTIFFASNEFAEQGLSGIQFSDRNCIGGFARSINELVQMLIKLKDEDMSERINSYRARRIFNVGHSSDYIVDCLHDIVNDRARDEWVRL